VTREPQALSSSHAVITFVITQGVIINLLYIIKAIDLKLLIVISGRGKYYRSQAEYLDNRHGS
jgi:hypothetical protein